MNARRIQVHAEGEMVRLRIESGFATVPLVAEFDLDPATALVLSGRLEAAVHTLSATPAPKTDNPTP